MSCTPTPFSVPGPVIQDLISKAKAQLGGSVDIKADVNGNCNHTKSFLHPLTKKKFLEKFGYDFEGDNSKPPNFQSGQSIFGVSGLAVDPESNIKPVANYVEKRVFGLRGLPEPFVKRAESELVDVIGELLKTANDNWQFHDIDKTYNEGHSSITVQGTISYAKAPRGGGVVDTIIYFVGVYYGNGDW